MKTHKTSPLVVITRPKLQSVSWLEAFQAEGFLALAFPTLEIEQLYQERLPVGWLALLQTADLILITSPNSIYCAPDEVKACLKDKESQLISMGKGTTQALVENHIKAAYTSPDGSTSEDLLNYPFFQSPEILQKTIVLLSGEGGRTKLLDVLKQRGAAVHKLALYRRILPKNLMPQDFKWEQNRPYIFVITSLTALEHLQILCPPEFLPWLQQQTFVVISTRIFEGAKQAGFHQVVNTHGMDLAKIVQAVKACYPT